MQSQPRGDAADKRSEQVTRDRAILIVRLSTFGGVVCALGLSWLFGDLAQAYLSGKPAAPTATTPPQVPNRGAPVQKPPTVVRTIEVLRLAERAAATCPRLALLLEDVPPDGH